MLRKLTAAFLIICLLFSFAHAQKNSWKKKIQQLQWQQQPKKHLLAQWGYDYPQIFTIPMYVGLALTGFIVRKRIIHTFKWWSKHTLVQTPERFLNLFSRSKIAKSSINFVYKNVIGFLIPGGSLIACLIATHTGITTVGKNACHVELLGKGIPHNKCTVRFGLTYGCKDLCNNSAEK